MSDLTAPKTPNDSDAADDPSPTRGIFKWLRGVRRARNGEDLRDTIEELIDDPEVEQPSLDADERALLRNILALHEVTVEDVMVPRADIVAVEADTSLDRLVEIMSRESHSRLPVFRGTLDEPAGMVHIKDVLAWWRRRKSFKIDKILRELVFAAPSMGVLDLLAQMRKTRVHMALVVDEFGGIDGLVTIEDLVEEIVGEIEDEHDDEEAPHLVDERGGTVLADARTPIEEFEARFGRVLTDEEREDVDTLGGLVVDLSGRVPARGELIKHSSGIEFEIVEADPRRVRRFRLRNLPPPGKRRASAS